MNNRGELKFLTLNVIVATYNRADLLRRTLASLANACCAQNLQVAVTVADNNSSDHTGQTIAEAAPLFTDVKLNYLFEPQQGKTFALNAALYRANADLIAVIDDDEEIAANWYQQVGALFGGRWDEIDFASGKVLPRWQTEPPPAWAKPGYAGIAWRDFGDHEWTHGSDTPIMSGGHSIIKRSIFDEIGFFDTNIGPTGKNLHGCEDDLLYDKLMSAEKTGVYDPRLIVYHFVPDYRLTKNYYRQWFYGNGASQSLMDTHYKMFRGARLLSVPRFMYRAAAKSLFATLRVRLSRERGSAFTQESKFWLFCGYFFERNLKNRRFPSALRRIAARILPAVVR